MQKNWQYNLFQMGIDAPQMEAGIEQYYNNKTQDLLVVNEKAQNVRRLQAQRNELNAKGKHSS